MPLVFLDVMNNALKRVGVIQGDTDALVTSTITSTATGLVATDAFTRSGIQQHIDLARQIWQEVTTEAYGSGMLYSEVATATLTLVSTAETATTREYTMPSDFERMAGDTHEQRVLRGPTNGLLLYEYAGGFAGMLADQPIATDWIGDPTAYALSPVNNTLRLDRCLPTSLNGETYNFLYEKRVALTATMATGALPFSDTVAEALVPVVAEDFQRWRKDMVDPLARRRSLARALAFLTRTQTRARYGVRRGW